MPTSPTLSAQVLAVASIWLPDAAGAPGVICPTLWQPWQTDTPCPLVFLTPPLVGTWANTSAASSIAIVHPAWHFQGPAWS